MSCVKSLGALCFCILWQCLTGIKVHLEGGSQRTLEEQRLVDRGKRTLAKTETQGTGTLVSPLAVSSGSQCVGGHRAAWFHVPKSATSFGTTLVHYVNGSLPRDAAIKPQVPHGPVPEKAFLNEFPVHTWFKDCLWEKRFQFGDHASISLSTFQRFKGDFMGIFRDPASRIRSAWNHFKHAKGDPRSYALKTQGGVTKMLAGQEYGLDCIAKYHECHGDVRHVNGYVTPNTAVAVERLDGFKFVGLVEEYDLSVCLFHAMFGGECLPVEFANMRPGDYTKSDTNIFERWPDQFDKVIYAKAKHIFENNMRQYNVSRSTCRAKHCSGDGVKHLFQVPTDIYSSMLERKEFSSYEYNWPGRYVYDDDLDATEDTSNVAM